MIHYNECYNAFYSSNNCSDERKWREWTDSHFVHLVCPNIYRTAAESLEAFKLFSITGGWDESFPRWERHLMVYVGACAMWLISKGLKLRYNIDGDAREHLYAACNQWTNELQKRQSVFHGGKTPDLADLDLYGILTSMEGLQAFSDLLNHTKIGQLNEYSRPRKNALTNLILFQSLGSMQ